MNYYKKIAEMLGVELGEEFSIKNMLTEDIVRPRYKITKEKGLMYSIGGKEWNRSSSLFAIFSGAYSIVKLPWKPKIYEQYWYCSIAGKPVVVATTWGGFYGDLCRWKCGNCFRTKGEAETEGKEIAEQIAKEFEEV